MSLFHKCSTLEWQGIRNHNCTCRSSLRCLCAWRAHSDVHTELMYAREQKVSDTATCVDGGDMASLHPNTQCLLAYRNGHRWRIECLELETMHSVRTSKLKSAPGLAFCPSNPNYKARPDWHFAFRSQQYTFPRALRGQHFFRASFWSRASAILHSLCSNFKRGLI